MVILQLKKRYTCAHAHTDTHQHTHTPFAEQAQCQKKKGTEDRRRNQGISELEDERIKIMQSKQLRENRLVKKKIENSPRDQRDYCERSKMGATRVSKEQKKRAGLERVLGKKKNNLKFSKFGKRHI